MTCARSSWDSLPVNVIFRSRRGHGSTAATPSGTEAPLPWVDQSADERVTKMSGPCRRVWRATLYSNPTVILKSGDQGIPDIQIKSLAPGQVGTSYIIGHCDPFGTVTHARVYIRDLSAATRESGPWTLIDPTDKSPQHFYGSSSGLNGCGGLLVIVSPEDLSADAKYRCPFVATALDTNSVVIPDDWIPDLSSIANDQAQTSQRPSDNAG